MGVRTMKCEYCGSDHNGEYASGRFCNEKCSRLYAIQKNKSKDVYTAGICKNCFKEFQVKRGTPKEWYICPPCKDLFHGTQKRIHERVFHKVTCNICKKEENKLISKPELKRYIENYNCDKCKSQINREAQLKISREASWDNAPWPERLRRLLDGQNNKCQICGIVDWNSKKIKFHMDHIDGNKNNNNKENLRLICPNCHSQTDTYCVAKNPVRYSDSQISESILKNEYDISKAIISLGLSNGGQNVVRFRKIYDIIRASGEIGRHVRLQSGAL